MSDSALPLPPRRRPPAAGRRALVLPLVLAVVSLVVAPPTLAGAAVASAVPVYLDGSPLRLPEPIYSESGAMLVPVRSYVQALGGSVGWEAPDQVPLSLDSHSLRLTIGSTAGVADGASVTLPVAVQLLNGRAYAPLRAVSEGLGARVTFDGRAVKVTSAHPAPQPWVQVSDGPLNIRTGPGTGAGIVSTVPVGTLLNVLARTAGWIQVGLPQGRSGWVAASFTQPATDPGTTEPPADMLQDVGYIQFGNDCLGPSPIVAAALYVPLQDTMKRIGGSYDWSGTTATASYGSARLVITPGNQTADLNGQPQTLPSTPWLIGGQVLVPIRTIADDFGLSVNWDAGRKTAIVSGSTLRNTGGAPCNPAVNGSAYIVMDARSGLVLGERAADAPLPIASTTKVMTALFALEQGNLDSLVRVSRYAASKECTCVPLRAGDVYPLRELLYGLILPSGNDAAAAIAEHISGGEWRFARAMTSRAAELGATHTDFYDPAGLDDNGHSSARDLALITRQALANPDFRAVVSSTRHTLVGSPGTTAFTLNRFLSDYPGATGVKNGWTPAAGHTLVASAYKNGRELIVVLLGSSSTPVMYSEAARLMDRGYQLSARNWLAGL